MKINLALPYQKYWNGEKMEAGINYKPVKLITATGTNLSVNYRP